MTMIGYLLKVAGCLAASYLFYHWLLRNDASFSRNRLFLLLTPLLAFLLPLAPLRSPFRSIAVATALRSDASVSAMATPPEAAHPGDPLALVYWAGAGLLILRILLHLFHLYRLQRRRPSERHPGFVLVRIESPIPPFSFFNRIFLHFPAEPDPRAIEQIISHETVHIRQLHSLDILLMELAVALQWFNPAAWLCRKALKETHEYLADREVIAQGFDAGGYRLLLFEQQLGAKLFGFASHLKQSQIKRRMFMMERMRPAGKAPLKFLLALPLLAFLALALAEPRLIMARGGTAGDDLKAVAQREETPAPTDAELRKMLADVDQKLKFLEAARKSTATAEEQQKLEQLLSELYKKRQTLLSQEGLTPKAEAEGQSGPDQSKLDQLLAKFAGKEEYLKGLYDKADSPEKKRKIREDLALLHQKRQQLLAEGGATAAGARPPVEELQKKLQMVQEKNLQLERLIAGEKNENRARELKAKREDLLKFEEELRIKIEKASTLKVR